MRDSYWLTVEVREEEQEVGGLPAECGGPAVPLCYPKVNYHVLREGSRSLVKEFCFVLL